MSTPLLSWQERLRNMVAPLPLHFAGVIALTVLNIYLIVHIMIALSVAHAQNEDARAQASIQMKAAEIQAQPLRGLDKKLAQSADDAAKFLADRIPSNYSTIAEALGNLTKKSGVRLGKIQYSEPASEQTESTAQTKKESRDNSAAIGLTEVRMDGTFSGDYRSLMLFLNGLERSKVFFLVEGVTLSGQQSGVVNLRIRITTYLRQPTPAELSKPAKPSTVEATP